MNLPHPMPRPTRAERNRIGGVLEGTTVVGRCGRDGVVNRWETGRRLAEAGGAGGGVAFDGDAEACALEKWVAR